MVGVLERVDVSALLAAAHNVVNDMQAADFTADFDDCLLDHLREFERLQRRLTMVGYALVSRDGCTGVAVGLWRQDDGRVLVRTAADRYR